MKKYFVSFIALMIIMAASLSICVSAESDLGFYDMSRKGEIYYKTLVEDLSSDGYLSSSNTYMKDEAGIFKDKKYMDEAYAEIVDAANKTGFNLAVFIGGKYRNDKETEDFTAEAAEFLFGKSADANTVFLYLDFEGKSSSYDFIDTFNDAYFYYPDGEADYIGFISEMEGENRIDLIFDDMYYYLPSSGGHIEQSKIVRAIRVFANDIIKYKEEGRIWGLYYRSAQTGMYRWTFFGNVNETKFLYIHPILFSSLGAAMAVFLCLSIDRKIRREYKFRETVNASVYTSSQSVQFDVHRDDFIRKNVTKHKIESSGGGGHSGHSGGSSHRSSSHHGGGRHR